MITSHQVAKVTDEFTVSGTGTLVDVSLLPMSKFTVVTTATGAVLTWTVVLEGSLDGSNFTRIATHTNLVGNNIAIYSGVNHTPCMFFRVRCTELTLGLGTKIAVTVIGVP